MWLSACLMLSSVVDGFIMTDVVLLTTLVTFRVATQIKGMLLGYAVMVDVTFSVPSALDGMVIWSELITLPLCVQCRVVSPAEAPLAVQDSFTVEELSTRS